MCYKRKIVVLSKLERLSEVVPDKKLSTVNFCSAVHALNSCLYLGPKNLNLGSRFWYPSVYPFLQGHREKRAYILYEKTIQKFTEALYLCACVHERGGSIYIHFDNDNLKTYNFYKRLTNYSNSSKRNSCTKAETIAFSNQKWTGGTFTNFQQIAKSMIVYGSVSRQFFSYLQKTPSLKTAVGSKFHGNLFTNPLHPEKSFKKFKNRPNLVIVENAEKNRNVISEASGLGIPVIAFAESNIDKREITLCVPLNSAKSYLLTLLLFTIYKINKEK